MTDARPPEDPAAAGGRVLLAEDNPANRKLALIMLSRLGYSADAVVNGAEAVEALGKEPYDVVLMDCRMPVLDGFGATAEIRRREGGARRTPIVAMTADAMEGDRQRCLEAGMDDYLAKPVTFESLASVLERWIRSGGRAPSAGTTEGPEPNAAGSVLDEASISGLRWVAADQGQERMAGAISVFLDEAESNVQGLRHAFERRDAASFSDRLHTLIGSAATFGAERLAELCRDLRRRVPDEGLEGIDAEVSEIEAELERVKVALRAEFPSGGEDAT